MSEPIDIVEVLRRPLETISQCRRMRYVTAEVAEIAAAEIARLREERRWVPVGERLPEKYQRVIVAFTPDSRGVVEVCEAVHNFGSDFETDKGCYECSHWKPLPPGPEAAG